MDSGVIVLLGVAVVSLGFMIILAGVLLSSLQASGGSKTSVQGGGVVFIGPIPVVFGTDRNTAYIAAAVGLALMLAYYLLFRR